MNKQITVLSLVSLVALGAIGCRTHEHMQKQPPMPATEMSHMEQVPADQLPSDVVRAVHQHVMKAQIINAETIFWKGKMAYKVYVLSGNTVYILKVRPDGYYLEMSTDVQ